MAPRQNAVLLAVVVSVMMPVGGMVGVGVVSMFIVRMIRFGMRIMRMVMVRMLMVTALRVTFSVASSGAGSDSWLILRRVARKLLPFTHNILAPITMMST